jgi:hypothetical protein
MVAKQRPQRDYVIEAINDLLADEEAGVFEPRQNQDLGAQQKRLSSGGKLSPPRPTVADLSRKDAGTVTLIRDTMRQERR